MLDGDADGILSLGANTRARDWGGYGNALSFNQGGATVTFAALTTMPSASIDKDGNIFVTYTSVIEGDVSADDENFSDIYVVSSKDNGKTWSLPQNLTQSLGVEDVFPCQTRIADNNLHIMFIEKNDPGIFVGQTSGNNPEQAQIPVKYMEASTAKILNNSIGVNNVAEYSFGINQNTPNPFNDIAL
ncbi:MAG: exo-alpha-sialidase [Bacteroidetes bacterium]|nr:exo-alpha-sialidase [Bacteroidota bacterium]